MNGIKSEQARTTVQQTGESEKAAVQNVYTHWAPLYDASFGGLVTPYRRNIRTAVAACNARDVLEIGIGTGTSLRHYPAGTKVTGIDICPEMLRKAERRVAEGVDAEVILRIADGESLDFPDASFDFVVMLFVVSVTPDPVALLNEVARVLRPGGEVLIINHFAGVKGIKWIERVLAPFSDRIGFHSQMPIETITGHHRFVTLRTRPLWPVGFFSLIQLKLDNIPHSEE